LITVAGKLIGHLLLIMMWPSVPLFLCLPIAAIFFNHGATSCSAIGEGAAILGFFPAAAAPAASIWRRDFSKRARFVGLLAGEFASFVLLAAFFLFSFITFSYHAEQSVVVLGIGVYFFGSAILPVIVAWVAMDLCRNAEARMPSERQTSETDL
jgi:hypothetical protein